jgi:hypothetical protein
VRRRRAATSPSLTVLLDPEAVWEVEGAGVPAPEVIELGAGDEEDATARLLAGIEQAGGELVIRIGSGEELLEGALPRLTEILAADPAAVAAYPAYEERDDDGTRTVVPEEVDLGELLRFQHVPAGPGALFRRPAAAEAARAALADPLPALGFWLRLAAAGSLRRVAAPLARRPAPPAPAPGGVASARARIEMVERYLAECGPAADAEASGASALRTASVLAAAEIGAGFNAADERVCVVDSLGLLAPPADPDLDARVLLLQARVRELEREAGRYRTAISVLEARAREGALGDA